MTQRTATEIAADLTAFRAARTALVSGERVEEVSRDGRRVVYAGITLPQVEAAIARLEAEYQQAVNVEAGKPRRRAIGLAWQN